MSTNPWGKFFWADWESDAALKLCSLAAQGLWMRMLCVAGRHDPTGYVAVNGRGLDASDIARLAGIPEAEAATLIDELDRNGVFSRDRQRRIYSRRMVRDAKKAAIARKNGKNGGNPTLRKHDGNPPSDNPPGKGRDKPHKPEARNQSLAALDSARDEDDFDERAELRRASSDRHKPNPPASHPRCAEVAERIKTLCNFTVPPPDGHLVNEWLADGIDPDTVIIPVVEDTVARLAKKNDRVRTFRLLDLKIREAVASGNVPGTNSLIDIALRRLPPENPAFIAREAAKAATGG